MDASMFDGLAKGIVTVIIAAALLGGVFGGCAVYLGTHYSVNVSVDKR